MAPSQWRRVEVLYQAVLERDPDRRPSFLAEACAGDEELRREVESLLAEGGMGEVFRATDTRLGHQIAIKTATEHFSERFEREGLAIAALNHPNICQLYHVSARITG